MNKQILRDDVESLLVLSDDDLMEKVGQVVLGKSAMPPSKKSKIENGKIWFENNRSKLHKALCGSEKVREIVDGNGAESRQFDVVVAIADAISSISTGFPVIVISVLLLKEGVHIICDSVWLQKP